MTSEPYQALDEPGRWVQLRQDAMQRRGSAPDGDRSDAASSAAPRPMGPMLYTIEPLRHRISHSMDHQHHRQLGEPIAKVDIYTERFSADSMNAKGLLDQKGANYNEFVVDDDPEERSVMNRRSGQTSVPQIFINGKSIGGWDQLQALDQAGELDAMLAVAPLAPRHSLHAEQPAAQQDSPTQKKTGLFSRFFAS